MLKATADRTSLIRWIPRRPLAAALDFAIKRTASRPAPAGVMSPRELVPTLGYDAQTVNGAAGALERFGMLSCEVFCSAVPGAPATSLPRSTACPAFSRAQAEW